MKHFPARTFAWIAFIILGFINPLTLLAAEDPANVYLNFFVTLQNAEKAESAGDLPSAMAKYKSAEQVLNKIKTQYPDWKKDIVDYRGKYVADKIASLADKVPAVAQPAPRPAPTAVQPTPSPSNVDSTTTTDSLPAPDEAPTQPSIAPVAQGSEELGELKNRIISLEKELDDTKAQLAQEKADKASLQEKLDQAEKALAQAKAEDFDARVADLMKENTELKARLATAEDQIKGLNSQTGGDAKVDNLREELAKVKEQLSLAQQQNESFRQTSEELKKQLDAASSGITAPTGGDETMKKENVLLRGIVERQQKDQARREAAKKLVSEELQKLAIKSAVLQEQIDILTSPYEPMAPDELALFRTQSDLTVSAASTGTTSAEISAPLNRNPDSGNTTGRPKVPAALLPVTEEAKMLFEKGKYDESAAKYSLILQQVPDNLYALSNLGVVHFQQGKYDKAEEALKKAITVAPNDAFSHSILGIVYYQKGKYDQAIESLTRSLAIDPKNAQAHNYLGIACSQKGWQENAEQEMRKAVEIDPGYADAHFNLAVIYATQKPPAKALAKRHYGLAQSFGMSKDPQLEKLLK
ncbi:MAG: tetratricopeptide repeat protein [Verrucomicrobiota bacterium]|nr:tetratricopeptide repeat protein [Verrucomicrobiota bacterium]